jgi:hypothetical protein
MRSRGNASKAAEEMIGTLAGKRADLWRAFDPRRWREAARGGHGTIR